MIKHSTQSALLHNLFALLAQHRPAFRQARSYWRVVGLVFGELFNFGRHTVTRGLMALGLTDEDWSSWYRLFSRRRYAESRVARLFFRETVTHTAPDEPHVVGVDGVQIPRSSLKMAGTSWLKAPRTPVFKVGIHRAQRFVHGAWLTPMEAGYSRAVPLRFLPAFPPKAKPAPVGPQREHQTRSNGPSPGRLVAPRLLKCSCGSYPKGRRYAVGRSPRSICHWPLRRSAPASCNLDYCTRISIQLGA